MAISVIGLFLLVVVGIGGVVLVTLIASLAGSRNRSAGPIVVGMLLLPLGIVCLLGVGAYFWLGGSRQQEAAYRARAQAEAARAHAEAAARMERRAREGTEIHPSYPSIGPSTRDEAVDGLERLAGNLDGVPSPHLEAGEDALEAEPTEETPVDEVAEVEVASAVEDDGSIAQGSASQRRPDWVDREEPFKDGSVYKWPLELELAIDRAEAEQMYLQGPVNEAIRGYIATRLRPDAGAADIVHLPQDHIDHMIVDTWAEPVHASTGDFVKLHVLLEFDGETNRLIEERWARHIAAQRLWTAGGLLAFGLLWLASAFAYLRVDLATEGKCRGRLRFVAAAAILAVATVVLLTLA